MREGHRENVLYYWLSTGHGEHFTQPEVRTALIIPSCWRTAMDEILSESRSPST